MNNKPVSAEWYRRKRGLPAPKMKFPKASTVKGLTTRQYVVAFCSLNHLKVS